MKRLRITIEGNCYEVEVELLDDNSETPVKSITASKSIQSSASAAPIADSRKPASLAPAGEGAIVSPLSAVVIAVDVAVGDTVKEGQKVITLEAMKMNTLVSASVSGTVEAINVSVGDAVEEGRSLIQLR